MRYYLINSLIFWLSCLSSQIILTDILYEFIIFLLPSVLVEVCAWDEGYTGLVIINLGWDVKLFSFTCL